MSKREKLKTKEIKIDREIDIKCQRKRAIYQHQVKERESENYKELRKINQQKECRE